MGSVFGINGWLYKGMQRLTDILVLNFCWLLGSLPIVTIGASTVAAMDIGMKLARKEEGYIFRGFWKSYKANFKQGFIMGLICLAIAYFYYIDIQIYQAWDKPIFLLIVMILAGILFFFYLIYAFPLLARYDNTIKQTLKNSMLFAIRFFPSTIWMTLQVAIIVAASLFTELMFIIGLLLGFGLIIYTISARSVVVFLRYEEIMAQYEAEEKKESETAENAEE